MVAKGGAGEAASSVFKGMYLGLQCDHRGPYSPRPSCLAALHAPTIHPHAQGVASYSTGARGERSLWGANTHVAAGQSPTRKRR
jgi:hypothetical protein